MGAQSCFVGSYIGRIDLCQPCVAQVALVGLYPRPAASPPASHFASLIKRTRL